MPLVLDSSRYANHEMRVSVLKRDKWRCQYCSTAVTMGVLAAERSDTTHMASLASQTAVTQSHHADGPAALRPSAFVGTHSAHDGERSRPLLLSTVLLI